MNELSRISVVLPSLDPDEKLVAVVDGLLQYGFTDIILVNDGSKAETCTTLPTLPPSTRKLPCSIMRSIKARARR